MSSGEESPSCPSSPTVALPPECVILPDDEFDGSFEIDVSLFESRHRFSPRSTRTSETDQAPPEEPGRWVLQFREEKLYATHLTRAFGSLVKFKGDLVDSHGASRFSVLVCDANTSARKHLQWTREIAIVASDSKTVKEFFKAPLHAQYRPELGDDFAIAIVENNCVELYSAVVNTPDRNIRQGIAMEIAFFLVQATKAVFPSAPSLFSDLKLENIVIEDGTYRPWIVDFATLDMTKLYSHPSRLPNKIPRLEHVVYSILAIFLTISTLNLPTCPMNKGDMRMNKLLRETVDSPRVGFDILDRILFAIECCKNDDDN